MLICHALTMPTHFQEDWGPTELDTHSALKEHGEDLPQKQKNRRQHTRKRSQCFMFWPMFSLASSYLKLFDAVDAQLHTSAKTELEEAIFLKPYDG